jgi:signal peptidase I
MIIWPFTKQSPTAVETPAQKKPWYREWSEAIIVAVILALIIRTFLVQAFKIPSGSMEDTLLIGDHLLVNKFIYGIQNPLSGERYLSIRDPQRGDVIVFEFPLDKNESYFNRRDFIKRVIGTPGDTIEVRNKKVYVNGELYDIPQEVHKESGVLAPQYGPRDNMAPVTVPPGHYFAMGDNRDRSFDSRFWGFVPEENIKGLAFIKYWSWNSDTSLPRWGRIGRLIE